MNALRVAAAVAALALMASCADDEPATVVPALYDIVTYTGQDARGARFEFQRDGDSPLVELTAPGYNHEKLDSPRRILLGYVPAGGEPYKSDDIRVVGWSQIVSDVLRQGNTAGWDADAVYMNALWRTGGYINLDCRVEYSSEPRRLSLMVDEATLTDPVPQLYVFHDRGDVAPGFSRQIYCSWDISALWNRAECEGVDVHLADSNRGIDAVSFRK